MRIADDSGITLAHTTLFVYSYSMKPCILVCAVFSLSLASCLSGSVTVPNDMTPNKIIQKAQEASDVNKYKIALGYYEALGERYGASTEYLLTSEYEIAFIHYKQKKYLESKLEFENILAQYKTPNAALLPAHFRILSEKVLTKIIEMGY